MRREGQRHQQLRWRTTETDRHDHNDRQQCGDRSVDADQCGQHGNQRHHENDQPDTALSGLGDQSLSCPGGHSCGVEASTDNKQRRDEDHRGIAKSSERFLEIGHSGEIQCERCAEGHEDDRNAVPDEQHHNRGDDGEGKRDAAHAASPTCAVAVSCRHSSRSTHPPRTMIEYLRCQASDAERNAHQIPNDQDYRPHDIKQRRCTVTSSPQPFRRLRPSGTSARI